MIAFCSVVFGLFVLGVAVMIGALLHAHISKPFEPEPRRQGDERGGQ